MNEQTEVDPTIIVVLLEAYYAFLAWRKEDRTKTRRRLQRALWGIYDAITG